MQPILDELIKTEETYVENLWLGINNYGNVFKRKDLPIGLRGKKYVLLGNVEHLAEFHRDEFLPMLKRNRHDLKRIFEEFIEFIEVRRNGCVEYIFELILKRFFSFAFFFFSKIAFMAMYCSPLIRSVR